LKEALCRRAQPASAGHSPSVRLFASRVWPNALLGSLSTFIDSMFHWLFASSPSKVLLTRLPLRSLREAFPHLDG
jgi:hypothetical protein